ncbi:MAG: hypothetical protein NWR72_21315 [Bacteroidia bacterium]|nr:hypothetical protein [Bacteroidia bacterium]
MAPDLSIDILRTRYQEAVQEEGAAKSLHDQLEPHSHLESGIHQAYRASAFALLGRYAWNPAKKLGFVEDANRVFRKAVRLDPQNPEIRFLRFAIQHHLPSFLNQSNELEEDKAVMLANLPRYKAYLLEPYHVASFLEFFRESGRFSAEELDDLSSVLSV